jgi:hypothetical protein
LVTTTVQNTSQETPVKGKAGKAEIKKTKYFPPDMAVRIAWALTHQLSESEAVHLEANRAKNLMEHIKEKAKGDEKEEPYVYWVCSAIEATYRDLVIIINGRNLNFDEVKKLRDTETENIQYYSQFTTDLQSSIPRISGMTIGGVGVAVPLSLLLEPYFPSNLKGYALLLMLAFGAAIGYIFNGAIVIPWIRRKKQMENIKLDYDKDLFYKQYVERSKAALIALYMTVDGYHNAIFGNFFEQEKAGSDDVKTIVDEMLSGISPTMCKNVTKCMNGKVITPDLWPICETGLKNEIEKCSYYIK